MGNALKVIDGKPEPVNSQFWSIDPKGKVSINDTKFIKFLENAGFATIRVEENIRLVQIKDNIIRKIIPTDIKKYVLEHLLDNEDVRNYMVRSKTFFKKEYLDAAKEIKPIAKRDTKDTAYYFYQNGVVEVTSAGIKGPINYRDLDYLVPEEKIINRDFKFIDLNERPTVFSTFLWKIFNENEGLYASIMSIIGYALHNYRTSANTKAIVFNDEIISDSPNGGSGKTLLAKALGYFRKLVIKDGKSFNPKNKHEWSDIKEGTDLVLIDDVKSDFSFEDLFSVVTEGISIENKYKDKWHMPIEQSPIILITSNKILRGNSSSFKRRQYNVYVGNRFNHKYSPIDEFGHTFFTDWDDDEWARFDCFMLNCVNYYLKNGIVQMPEKYNQQREAISATNKDFVDWVVDNSVLLSSAIRTGEARRNYLESTGQKNGNLSDRKFRDDLKKICEIFGWTLQEHRTQFERGFYIVFQ